MGYFNKLLDREKSVNAMKKQENSGSHLTQELAKAASKGKAKAIGKLLEQGADVNAKHKGKPILRAALKSGDADSIALLVGAGADPNGTVNDKGKTMLMEAAETGKTKLVSALLELGADVNLQDKKDRQTALLLACWEGHQEIAQMLLARGADAKHKKKGGKTALMYAAHSGNPDLVKMVLALGLDANKKNSTGQNALMYAVEDDKKVDVVTELIAGGANVNQLDDENKVVLFYAAHYGSIEIAKRCLDAGADVTLIDQFGDNVLAYAKQAANNSEELLALFASYGVQELARCTSYKVQVTCTECSQPIMVNGPARRIKCGSCQSEQKLRKGFWKELFKDSNDLGGTTTTMGQTSHKVEYRKSYPACSDCKANLDLSALDPASEGPAICPACGRPHSTFQAPDWLRQINAKGQVADRIFCAEREGEGEDAGAKSESLNPIAIRCISCAAPLTVTVQTPRNAVCGHCATTQYLPDPLWLSLHPVKKAEKWYVLFAEVEPS